MADLSTLVDEESEYLVEQIKAGDDEAVYELLNKLQSFLKEPGGPWCSGPRTRVVLSTLFKQFSAKAKLANDLACIANGNRGKFFELLSIEVSADPINPLANHLAIDVLSELYKRPALVRKAFGRRRGPSVNRTKKNRDMKIALLVLYYHDKVGRLNDSRSGDGAYRLAAAHLFKCNCPTDSQVRRARYSWENNEKEARSFWRSICDPERNVIPEPAEDYDLSAGIFYLFVKSWRTTRTH